MQVHFGRSLVARGCGGLSRSRSLRPINAAFASGYFDWRHRAFLDDHCASLYLDQKKTVLADLADDSLSERGLDSVAGGEPRHLVNCLLRTALQKEPVRISPDQRYHKQRINWERPVFLTTPHAKRVRPAAAPCFCTTVLAVMADGAIWLGPPGSFG
jgi:hypothetical protein